MTPVQAHAACDFLYALWQDGLRVDALPDELRPHMPAEGYAVQAWIEERSATPPFGWKLAATSLAGQAHIGVDGPLIGRILAERVIGNGGECALGSNLMRVAELEFAFRFAEDITPGTPLSDGDLLNRIGSLHPAIEIPDSRFDNFERVGAPQLIADNACAHRFLLGAEAPDLWRGLDLAAHAVRGTINDGPPRPGIGSNVLGGPLIALRWFVDEMSALGITIRAGQIVTTGTCLPPMTIAPGDRVHGDFGALGQVSIAIS